MRWCFCLVEFACVCVCFVCSPAHRQSACMSSLPLLWTNESRGRVDDPHVLTSWMQLRLAEKVTRARDFPELSVFLVLRPVHVSMPTLSSQPQLS